MATEIKLTVRCQGCLELIEKPSEADMALWRLGLHVHKTEACVEALAVQLEARGVSV